MKKIHLLGLVFFILSLTSIVQAAKFFVKAEPEAGMLNGTTDYSLEISGYITDTIDGTPYNGKKEIGSLLEFPIDSWLTGGTLIIEDSTGTWALYLGGRVALTNPADKMKDSDWDGFTPHYPRTLWSYTESDVEQSLSQFELSIRKRFSKSKSKSWSLIAGGRYQKISQDVIGISGYQRMFSPTAVDYDPPQYFENLYDNVSVIEYEISYKSIILGFNTETILSPKISVDFTGLFMPTFYSDRDDHILRKKLSTSDGDGLGGSGKLLLGFFPGTINNRKTFIKFGAEYTYYSVSGNQTQSWYETTSEADAGTTITNIPHEITSKQLALSLSVGFSFK